MFGGSGTVLLNTEASNYIYNDVNPYVASIFNGLCFCEPTVTIREIESIIEEYALSKTNKEGFERLREDYNRGKNDWLTLYVLMCHSFNHQFRFNSKHEYNSSFGSIRAYFSDKQKADLYAMRNKFEGNVIVASRDFTDFDYTVFNRKDFLYFDPPYLNSSGNYNDGKRGFEGWTQDHEKKLLHLLDDIDSVGLRFALSNNLKYDNPLLGKWKDKYTIHYLSGEHINSHYNKSNRTKDIEVLITNYR